MKDICIPDLWRLNILRITDPSEKRSREETAPAARQLFLDTVKIDDDGQYVVRLPWVQGHSILPSNYVLVQKRLAHTTEKLRNNNLLEAYDSILQDWLQKKIIEEVPML